MRLRLLVLQITDFGLSKVIDEGSFLKSLVGTPLYVGAPRALQLMRVALHHQLHLQYGSPTRWAEKRTVSLRAAL